MVGNNSIMNSDVMAIVNYINYKCKRCGEEFDCDVGKINFSNMKSNNWRPRFEKEIKCPNCGVRTFDEVELTECGQTQLTGLWLADKG